MATTKGNDTRIFSPATTNEVIIRTTRYRQNVETYMEGISTQTKNLTDEELLAGGLGTEITESIKVINSGLSVLQEKLVQLVLLLNKKLGAEFELNAVGKAAGMQDSADKASKAFSKKE